MLDIQLLRQNLSFVSERLKLRGVHLDEALFNKLESERKQTQTYFETLQAERNHYSKQIGILKGQQKDTKEMMEKVAQIGEELNRLKQALEDIQTQLQNFLLQIPNLPDDTVPEGRDEEANQEIKRVGEAPQFAFVVKDHVDLGAKLGLDFETGVKLSGARFTFMKRGIARLHRALAQWMLDVQTLQNGYTECYTPYLVNSACLLGTGQLPKFEEDLFYVSQGQDKLYLIPTSEVTLTNIVRDEIIALKDLPIKLTSHTPCFRSEAGAYGKDTRGMIRQHQFDKVEMVQIVEPSQGESALNEMVGHAENLLQALKLPYRVMLLSTGDMGFSASKTYDLEVWLPSQNTYREISSVSLCRDFQSRRLKARFRNENGKTECLYTLNGSGLAVGRTLIAVMENYQNIDGSITIPEVIRPYMGGMEKIG